MQKISNLPFHKYYMAPNSIYGYSIYRCSGNLEGRSIGEKGHHWGQGTQTKTRWLVEVEQCRARTKEAKREDFSHRNKEAWRLKYTLELKRVERDRCKKNGKVRNQLKHKCFVYRIVWTSVYQETVKYAVRRSNHIIHAVLRKHHTRENRNNWCKVRFGVVDIYCRHVGSILYI